MGTNLESLDERCLFKIMYSLLEFVAAGVDSIRAIVLVLQANLAALVSTRVLVVALVVAWASRAPCFLNDISLTNEICFV